MKYLPNCFGNHTTEKKFCLLAIAIRSCLAKHAYLMDKSNDDWKLNNTFCKMKVVWHGKGMNISYKTRISILTSLFSRVPRALICVVYSFTLECEWIYFRITRWPLLCYCTSTYSILGCMPAWNLASFVSKHITCKLRFDSLFEIFPKTNK